MVKKAVTPVNIGLDERPTTKDSLKKDINEIYAKPLTKKFNLDEDFLNNILDSEYDSQIVMILATLVEGMVFSVTEREVRKVEPTYIQAHLEETICGKSAKHSQRIDFLKKGGLLFEREEIVLKMLGTVRNKFAHKPENLCKTLNDFYLDCDEGLRKQLKTAVLFAVHDRKDLNESDTDEYLSKNFKIVLIQLTLVAAYGFLSRL